MFKKIILVCSVLALVLTVSPVVAQEKGQGLTLSPPLTEMTLLPGQTYPLTIKLSNPTRELVELYPTAMNFKAKGEGGEPTFSSASEEGGGFSLANWITFSQSKLALTPQQVMEFNYQIKVPGNAEPGGHYGVVFFATTPPKPDQNLSQVAIASMVGSLILIKVPGAITESANLAEFSADKKFYSNPPVNLTTRIANLGNIHFKPQGDIKITNWRGKKVSSLTLNESKGNILPDSTRKFSNAWSPSTSPFYKTPIGKFKANLSAVYGEGNKTLSGEVVFWIIPLWLIITVSVIILLIVLLIVCLVIRKKKKARTLPKKENSVETPVN